MHKTSRSRWRRRTIALSAFKSPTTPLNTLCSHLILGVRWEVLAVKVGSDDDPPRCLRVLRRDDVRESLGSIRSLVRERVLFYMPVELLQRVDDIIPDLSVVCGTRCFWGVTWDIKLCGRPQKSNVLTRPGYKDP